MTMGQGYYDAIADGEEEAAILKARADLAHGRD